MRKLRIFAHISLDGMISPSGDNEFANGGWTAPYRSPAGLETLVEAQGSNFDLLLARHTYDLWSGFWPTAGNFAMANSLNAATKYVVTHRPESLEWGPIGQLGTDAIASIRGLKSTEGPDLILWGSSTLTPILLKEDLVDEVVLLVYPVLLGEGKRFFADGVNAHELSLVNSKTTQTGVLINTYTYARQLGL